MNTNHDKSYWAVARTKVNSEYIAKYNLDKQNFESYLPKYQDGIGKDTKIKVLFPGYIFVKIELQWHKINNTRGIITLIMNEVSPARLPDIVIKNLKAREDKKGYIVLPSAPPRFKIGDKVKIANGPLSGYDGLYAGMKPNERVRVLIQLLGQQVPVELDDKDLAAVAIDQPNASDVKVQEEKLNHD